MPPVDADKHLGPGMRALFLFFSSRVPRFREYIRVFRVARPATPNGATLDTDIPYARHLAL